MMIKEVKERNEKRKTTDLQKQCRRIFFSLKKSQLDLAFISLCLENKMNVKDEESQKRKTMMRLQRLRTRLKHLFRSLPVEYTR